MPREPPTETFGSATFRLTDGIPIETFGTPILTSGAFKDIEGASIFIEGIPIETFGTFTLRLGA